MPKPDQGLEGRSPKSKALKNTPKLEASEAQAPQASSLEKNLELAEHPFFQSQAPARSPGIHLDLASV